MNEYGPPPWGRRAVSASGTFESRPRRHAGDGLNGYFGSVGAPGVVVEGRFEPGAGVEASGMVGGVAGMLVEESDGMVDEVGGFTEPSGVVEVELDVEAELSVAGAVAEVSVDMPVEAEPLHQSLLARTLGEAFR
jgi:hypothetical protein